MVSGQRIFEVSIWFGTRNGFQSNQIKTFQLNLSFAYLNALHFIYYQSNERIFRCTIQLKLATTANSFVYQNRVRNWIAKFSPALEFCTAVQMNADVIQSGRIKCFDKKRLISGNNVSYLMKNNSFSVTRGALLQLSNSLTRQTISHTQLCVCVLFFISISLEERYSQERMAFE